MINIRAVNNFDFLRFVASSLVLFSHCFPLVNQRSVEPLVIVTGGRMSLGHLAVVVFFIISGFLISASWDNRKDFSKFLAARIRRIFPGLAVMLGMTVLAGWFLTTVDDVEYLQSALIYFGRNLTLYKGTFDLAGVFNENIYGPAVNGSLWTLRHEFTCYLLVGFLGATGLLSRPVVWLVWFGGLILSLGIVWNLSFLNELFPLVVWFSSGMLAYQYRALAMNKNASLGLMFVCLVLGIARANLILVSPIIAYLLIKLVYAKSPVTNFGRFGDFSYGIYIYAFPIQQLVIHLITKSIPGPVEWWVVFIVSFPLTWLFSIASWHLVEKQFLGKKGKPKVSVSLAPESQ